jgi:two-component system KDP operon response regulator KdpE
MRPQPVRRIVKIGGEDVKLSPKEYELLRLLIQHEGKVLTHKFLLKELWSTSIDPQYLRIYVRQLRNKIEPDPARPQYLNWYRLSAEGAGLKRRSSTTCQRKLEHQ